ncbi:MATE family efflux transporter [Mobilitalea sibirica]|nr:MATE family efflux transporter [Mobilitalea sibirica]
MNLISEKEEKRHFYKLVFSLVLPMALQNLINVGVHTADVVMLGKVGETVLSASSLAGQVQFIMFLFLFGLTSGAGVLTAQYWGKKDIRTIEKVMGITMRIGFVVAVLFTIVVLLFPYQIMRIFSNEDDVIREGVSYLRIIAISYVFTAITLIYLNIMRSIERVIISTIVYLVSLIVNVSLNAIFIFGMFGLEPMGIRGAALATLIARLIELSIVLFYAKFKNKVINFHIKDLFPHDKLLFRDFIKYSMPVLINEIIWGVGTSTIAAIIGHLGKSAVAANSITQVTRQLAMVVSFGLANATAILIGKAIGQNKEDQAKLYAKRFIRLSVIMGIIGAFVILSASVVVKDILSLSDQAKSYMNFFMFVMSYFAIGQSFNAIVVVGVCRAGGDTKFGLYLDAGFLWGVSILLGFIAAFVLKLPVPIVYMVLLSDEILKIPVSYWRYRSMKWLKNVTR